jgi:predicted nuclease of restriction endonuclease-like RecB superfamily
LLPQALLRVNTRVEGDRIVPHYLTAHDEPWLRSLMDECARFVGRKRTELHARLREPLPTGAPKAKLQIAIHVLDGLCRERTTSAIPPKEARAAVFREASATPAPRSAVITRVAKSFGVTTVELESALFADLRGERRVAELPKSVSPSQLALDANVAIVTSLVRRAVHVRISVWGNSRALVRHARLVGLICRLSGAKNREQTTSPGDLQGSNISRDEAPDGVVLEVSGPFALFRHTEVYGRALASLVPRMAWCNEYELTAACALGRGSQLSTFVLRTGDPIGAGRELARHDSRLEETFDRDFRRAARDWDVIREPRPVSSGNALIFPDFELVHRGDKNRRWLLEIVGFWTQKYLTEKLERLRAAGIERLVLCIAQNRHCAEGDLPRDARVIRYKTRIDPKAVLAVING